ncbi:MAG TPA: DUF4132 domain-containing protein [Piscinibacter sp.]|nr:DUF4132 domain-containing protein [Piscinibacter sp.]HPM65888.1 DUF4132 domain-containing protein [Piscinibacter sp.]
MLKWMAKLLDGEAFELPPGVPEAWVQRLEKLLEPLDKVDGGKGRKGLARDIIGFVLHGEPMAVLSEVSQRPEVGERFRLTGYHYGRGDRELPDVFEQLGHVPAAVALRWARLLEASVKGQSSSCRMQLPRGIHWPEVLLMASTESSVTGWSSQRPKARGLSCQQLETMLREDGLDPSALIVACFATPVDVGYGAEQRLLMLTDLPDYPQALERHLEAIRPHLLAASVAQRVHALAMLEPASAKVLDELAPQLCELGVASSKQVRVQAEGALRRCGTAASVPLRELALHGKPEQRLHALRLLYRLADDRGAQADVAFARKTAAADKAPSVQALVAEWEAGRQAEEQEEAAYEVVLPTVDWSAASCHVPKDALARLWKDIDESISRSNASMREHHARMTAQGHKFPLRQDEPFTGADAAALQAYLDSGRPQSPDRSRQRGRGWNHVAQAAVKLADTEGVGPAAMFKVLQFFDIATSHDGMLMHPAIQAFNAMHRRIGRPTLIEISCMLEAVGRPGQALLRNYCHSWGAQFAGDWPNEHVWPYFAHHLEAVLQALLHNTIKDYAFGRAGLFRAIATLPKPPAAAINALFTLALGSGKTDRMPAQEALQHQPDKEARIIAALTDGKAETRAVAALWLARLRHQPAVPALEKAVAKEKHDLAKGAMLDALQVLGQPVERYLDRGALAAEAAKSLAKGMPKGLEYFSWSALPEVRWADSGASVPPDVLRWMIVQAVKQKMPEPNAVLRKYCEMFDARDREALGQFVLETWLREDVRPISPDEAMLRAQSEAQSTYSSMASYPQYYQNSPNLGKSVQELTAAFLPAQLRQPAGSAIATKGLLAVAAACARERAAGPTQRYLKEWYGSRAAQGKALIAMLAWIDHPSATQLMLAIGSRFRTKSFQEEATRQAEALAERKGWTLAELADRTVPSAGFDETGTLELSYGSRSFTARLLPDFKIELFNPEGKKIAALPEPRQDDDAEQAKEAKKALSAAKKELKSIVDLQTGRLYEALCTEREWPAADWATYLQQHPVLRHLVQRLVWVELIVGTTVRTFRPLDDGTLTDHEDNTVVLAESARVRLAHDSLLDAAAVSAWQQHLVDYEIKPLFQQLGKGNYALPEAKAKDDAIKDFEGHLIEAFALRGRALKLGYTRGPAEDGGWFHVYEKRFPTLGLQAVIEFTGNPLPEENRTVALLNLSFASSADNSSWQRGKLTLAKVPKVLLSECYNDLRLIAADGTGYDADWQKKSEY